MLEGRGEGGPDLAALESVLQLQMFPFMRGVGVGCSPSRGGCYPVFGGEHLHPHLFGLELLSLGVKICNLDSCTVLNFVYWRFNANQILSYVKFQNVLFFNSVIRGALKNYLAGFVC